MNPVTLPVFFQQLIQAKFSPPPNPDQPIVTYNDGKKMTGLTDSMPDGDVIIEFPDKRLYIGPIVDGVMQGWGDMRWPNGKVYSGPFDKGEMTGETAKIIFSNGDCYYGPTQNGLAQGKGEYYFYAKSSKATYEGMFDNGQFNGLGTLTSRNGDWYEGNFVDGELQGEGKEYIAQTGEIFEGRFKEGKRELEHEQKDQPIRIFRLGDSTFHGLAQGIYSHGSYVGNYVEGRMEGKGFFVETQTGNTYKGDFVNNLFDGEGTYTFFSGIHQGDKYIGGFKEGERHGAGQYIGENGFEQVGTWVNNVFTEGKLTYSNGDYREGIFDPDGLCTGKGKITYKDAIYEGLLDGGKPHGRGVKTFLEGPHKGDVYIGQFVHGERTGRGVYKWSNGDQFVGESVDNCFVQGELTFQKGGRFNGKFENEKMTSGIYTYGNGDKYTGPFVNNEPEGVGKMEHKNGNVYTGPFVAGKPSGQGKLVSHKGMTYVGPFVEGKLHGLIKIYFNGKQIGSRKFTHGEPPQKN